MLLCFKYYILLWTRYHPMWFKTFSLKDNSLFKLLLGKQTNISPFPATHTHIKLMFVSFFLNFFCTFSLPQNIFKQVLRFQIVLFVGLDSGSYKQIKDIYIYFLSLFSGRPNLGLGGTVV